MIASLLLPLLLQSADAYPECNRKAADMGLQQEMNICAHRDFLTADAAMNAQWRLTREHMRERDAQWDPEWDAGQGASEGGRPGFFATLLEAQRAWIAFRDAHCDYSGFEARGGSMEPMLVGYCLEQLTLERIKQLTDPWGQQQ